MCQQHLQLKLFQSKNEIADYCTKRWDVVPDDIEYWALKPAGNGEDNGFIINSCHFDNSEILDALGTNWH